MRGGGRAPAALAGVPVPWREPAGRRRRRSRARGSGRPPLAAASGVWLQRPHRRVAAAAAEGSLQRTAGGGTDPRLLQVDGLFRRPAQRLRRRSSTRADRLASGLHELERWRQRPRLCFFRRPCPCTGARHAGFRHAARQVTLAGRHICQARPSAPRAVREAHRVDLPQPDVIARRASAAPWPAAARVPCAALLARRSRI
mmetsp:Transcript_17276/g.45716  ORF Transcript_17276/g.45716 Transcript_17276/m.45716 type:complete len:200 (-) Transcript_17276:104-703(-)